jgi:hypothetical protein
VKGGVVRVAQSKGRDTEYIKLQKKKILTKIKAKSINCNSVKFIIPVAGSHCEYSRLEPKSYPRH